MTDQIIYIASVILGPSLTGVATLLALFIFMAAVARLIRKGVFIELKRAFQREGPISNLFISDID